MKVLITGVAACALTAAAGAMAMSADHHPPPPAAPVHKVAQAAYSATSSYTLSPKKQYQQTGYYCVPASGAMSLSTFGITVKQTTLAKKMKTTKNGTNGANATPVLNAYVKSKGYEYTVVKDVVGHSSTLMSRVSYDIGTLHRAPTVSVWMEKLPWNKGKVKGTKIGHAVIAYGYDTKKGTITLFDPWKATGGTHTISATTLAGTLQETGGMRYISRI